MLNQIKSYLGSFILNNQIKAKKAKNKFMPYKNAIEIGIVYNAESIKDEQKVQQFANELRADGKKVLLLGFLDVKELPFNRVPHISCELYWKEKLNFFNLPNPEKIGRFINTKFDILFNIYHEENISLQGISVLSNAKYQVGAQMNRAVKLFDLTIDTGDNKDVYYLAKQMEHYISTI